MDKKMVKVPGIAKRAAATSAVVPKEIDSLETEMMACLSTVIKYMQEVTGQLEELKWRLDKIEYRLK